MSFSWLGFGKKKAASETDVSSDNNTPVHEDNDDFIVIEKNPNKNNMYPSLGGGGSAGTLPYQVQPYPGVPRLPVAHDASEALSLISSNPLDDVPFKLSSMLDTSSCGWTGNDMAHFKALLGRVSHLNENVFKYDFKNEESTIKEEQGSREDR